MVILKFIGKDKVVSPRKSEKEENNLYKEVIKHNIDCLLIEKGHIDLFELNYGFIGAVILIATIVYLDIHIIKIGISAKNKVDKCVVSGIISMLIFSQVQNIGMNIGLLPITGITLPFISYGGSSLISNAIAIGILLNISSKRQKTIFVK